ncbi:MAG: peptidoglycan-binding domain-containing protein [Myxococcota bacterium]
MLNLRMKSGVCLAGVLLLTACGQPETSSDQPASRESIRDDLIFRPQVAVSVERAINDDGRFSVFEFSALGSLDIETLRTLGSPRFVDALGAQMGRALVVAAERLGEDIAIWEPMADLHRATDLLRGDVVLEQGVPARPGLAETVQGALMAIASRYRVPELALARYGADGAFGEQSEQAVRHFQEISGLPITGIVDAATGQMLDRWLRNSRTPGLLGSDLSRTIPGPQTIVDAVNYLVDVDGTRYATLNASGGPMPWVCRDPNHALWSENNVDYDFNGLPFVEAPLFGSGWKCNLFMSTALYLAGFMPGYYESGEYPIAVEMHRFTSDIQGPNSPFIRFEMVAEVNLDNSTTTAEERRQRVADALAAARVGDAVMVDHGTGGAADDGHSRLLVDNSEWDHGDGVVLCAQSRSGGAEIVAHTVTDFSEDELWLRILRPITPWGRSRLSADDRVGMSSAEPSRMPQDGF